MGAIDDATISVNVSTTTASQASNGTTLIGDAFMGNTVTCDPVANINFVEANVEVNPALLQTKSDFYNKPGADMMHAVGETYFGAQISQYEGRSSPASNDRTSVWPQAHANAPKESGPVYFTYYDAQGNEVDAAKNPQPRGGVIVNYLQSGNKVKTLLTTPIPK